MQTISDFKFGKLLINGQNKDTVEIRNDHGHVLINNFLNAHICSVQSDSSNTSKITFSRDPSAQQFYALVNEIENNQKVTHYCLQWVNPLPDEEFCVHIGGEQHWYTTYEEVEQMWPMNKNKHFDSPQPFVTNDYFNNLIGSVIENLFLGSNGFAIYVEKDAPLFLRRDNNNGNPMLCFSGDYHKSPYNHTIDSKQTKIVFHLMSASDIMHVYRYSRRWIPKPKGIPDQRMIKYPIWSTWAKYHTNIDQDKVVEFAKQISSYGFPNSQLEIDDKWEVKYGDFAFDPQKFPNPKQMTTDLKSLGFRTTLWVYPFVNEDSDVFHKESKYFIKSQNGSILVQNWWNGRGAHIDFTNKDAQNWFVSRLETLKETIGIDSFKFDAGELGWVSPDFQFNNQTIHRTPALMSKLFSETCSRLGNAIETRVGYSAQHLPIFVRMMDKNSVWDYSAGLRTLIPTALMMSIAGYPFILADMIGGNAYNNQFPSKEMYIRWLQVNTLMPALQFSIPPWHFEDPTAIVTKIAKSMLKLHEQFAPLMITLAKNAVKTGEPIMRPLWWIAPTDSNTFNIDSEFLVGNDLLVAPVTTENARQRDIYLPSGEWKDHRGVEHKGPTTLTNFKADLHELPYFTRTQAEYAIN